MDLASHLTSGGNKAVQIDDSEDDLFKTITPDKDVKKKILNETDDFPDLSNIDLDILDIDDDDEEDEENAGWDFA